MMILTLVCVGILLVVGGLVARKVFDWLLLDTDFECSFDTFDAVDKILVLTIIVGAITLVIGLILTM